MNTAAVLALFISQQVLAVHEPSADTVAAPNAASRSILNAVSEGWRSRERAIHTAEFEWTESRVRSPQFLAPDETLAEPMSEECAVHAELHFRDDRIRHVFRKSTWSLLAPRNENAYVGVFDGCASRIYFPPGYICDYPRGHVSIQARSEDLKSAYLKPLLWAFRPSLPEVFPFSVESMTLDGSQLDHEGRNCIVIRSRISDSLTLVLLLDPLLQYAIVKYSVFDQERVALEYDIRYTRDTETGVCVPQSWSFSVIGADRQLLVSSVGTIQRYVLNPQIPDSTFAFEFPEGTWVHAGRNEQYIVETSGEKHHLFGNERLLPYITLLNFQRHRGVPWWWLVALNVTSLFLIIPWTVLRRRDASRSGDKRTRFEH